MSSQDQTPQKRERAYSTVAPTIQPYNIPKEMVSNTKNFKFLHESKASAVENYFFKTKVHSDNDTQSTVKFRKSLKPKVQNKLHLDLPSDKKVQVHKYVGQQKHFEQSVGQFFAKIFKSCLTPETQEDYKECDYCERQYSPNDEIHKKNESLQFAREMAMPYVSYRRLNERQKQPIQVFYQEITNEPITNNRWETAHSGFRHF